MLIHSMSVSVDGFIADREGAFGWTVPSDFLPPVTEIVPQTWSRPERSARA
jgi:hypothetical protein